MMLLIKITIINQISDSLNIRRVRNQWRNSKNRNLRNLWISPDISASTITNIQLSPLRKNIFACKQTLLNLEITLLIRCLLKGGMWKVDTFKESNHKLLELQRSRQYCLVRHAILKYLKSQNLNPSQNLERHNFCQLPQ